MNKQIGGCDSSMSAVLQDQLPVSVNCSVLQSLAKMFTFDFGQLTHIDNDYPAITVVIR